MNEEQMPQQEVEQSVNQTKWYTPLTKTTPLSKYLAMVLFIALPFVGFWLGYTINRDIVITGDGPEHISEKSYSSFELPKQTFGYVDLSDGLHFFDTDENAEILLPDGLSIRKFRASSDADRTILVSTLDLLPPARHMDAFFVVIFGNANRVINGVDANDCVRYRKAGYESEGECIFPMTHSDGRKVEITTKQHNERGFVTIIFEYNAKALSPDEYAMAQDMYEALSEGIAWTSDNLPPTLPDYGKMAARQAEFDLACNDPIPGEINLAIDASMSKQDIADFINQELLDIQGFAEEDISYLGESYWYSDFDSWRRFELDLPQAKESELTKEYPAQLAHKIESAAYVNNVNFNQTSPWSSRGRSSAEGHIYIVHFSSLPDSPRLLQDFPELIEVPEYLTVVAGRLDFDEIPMYGPNTRAYLHRSMQQNVEILNALYADIKAQNIDARIIYDETSLITFGKRMYLVWFPYEVSALKAHQIIEQFGDHSSVVNEDGHVESDDFIHLYVPLATEQDWIDHFNSEFRGMMHAWQESVTCYMPAMPM